MENPTNFLTCYTFCESCYRQCDIPDLFNNENRRFLHNHIGQTSVEKRTRKTETNKGNSNEMTINLFLVTK